MYNVTGAAIKKAAIRHGIDLPKRRKINPNEVFRKNLIGKKPIRTCKYCGKPLKPHQVLFCSQKCNTENRYVTNIQNWKLGKIPKDIQEDYIPGYIIRYLREKYDNKCQLCGWNKINECTGKVPLQIHHIDGNHYNNEESNLQLLCPNCHSLTPTFGALNKKRNET